MRYVYLHDQTNYPNIMKNPIIFFLLFSVFACGGKDGQRFVKVYPQYEPHEKDSIVPPVQIFMQDMKVKEIGIMYDTPEFTFRTTGDEPLKISANKYSANLAERDVLIGVESKQKHCIDAEKEVNFYFSDGTFLKFIPDDDGVDPCPSYISFDIRGQFSDPDKEKLWTKLLQVPLQEVRVIVKTKESNSILQGLTKEQGVAFMQSVQMLDTTTTGVPRNN